MFNSRPSIRIVADFNSPSGYSKAATDYVIALDSAGWNVIPTFPKSSWSGADVDQGLLNKLTYLSKRQPKGDTLVIEEMVPELMSENRNIAYCVWETTVAPKSWAPILNKKICVLTCSEFSKQALINAGVTVPVYVLPHAVNPLDSNDSIKLQNNKKKRILSIADFTERKNLENIVIGYLISCNGRKDVELVLKTCTLNPFKSGMKVKRMLEIAKQKAIYVLTQNNIPVELPDIYLIDKILEERYIGHLYKSCDIYLTASYGEAFNLPLAEAMYFGLTSICPAQGGHTQFASIDNSIMMEGVFQKAGGVEGNGRYNDAGDWYYVNFGTIAAAINYALENDTSEIAANGKSSIRSELSYSKIASMFEEIVNEVHNPMLILNLPKQKAKEKEGKPFVVKCIQVLNEEQLIKANLRNRYDDVDLILITEGAAKGRPDQVNGHSKDSTLKKIEEFIKEEDKDSKIVLMTKKNGFNDYEEIKNMMAFFINQELQHIKNKIVLIMDADEAITKEDFDGMIETFNKNPECSEVVPSFIHYFDNTNTIYRPIPSSMNIKHQRFIRWPRAGGVWINHPTLTDYATGQDTACDQRWQSRRICVDYKIHHYGDCKSVEFYKNKHDYYKKEIRGYVNNDRDWIERREFKIDRLLSYDGPQPKEFKSLFSNARSVVELPHWLTSNAYNGSVKLQPLFTGMEDDLFEYKG